jgi:hypothetical protein
LPSNHFVMKIKEKMSIITIKHILVKVFFIQLAFYLIPHGEGRRVGNDGL